MRRHLGIVLTILLVIGVIIAISAAGAIEFDRPFENELSPNRSSYNSGPTGTRALYQFLEESGIPVARWREDYSSLKERAKDATLVIVGPFQLGQKISDQEAAALQAWISSGGRALIISRSPIDQFGDPVIHSKEPERVPDWNASPEQVVNDKSDELIAQPTALTRNLRGLALSAFASRLNFYPPEEKAEEKAEPLASPQVQHDIPSEAVPAGPKSEEKSPLTPSPNPEPTTDLDNNSSQSPAGRSPAGERAAGAPEPAFSPAPGPTVEADSGTPAETTESEDDDDYSMSMLYAPVIHLGDKDGAALADFTYDKGRVLFLSDPFVAANNGIGMGANLTLVMNILRSMGGRNRTIYFDEFHHGYHSQANPLVNYFRGTPVPWLLFQGLLLSLLILYTYGRRFARPLPLPQEDRHSPLEFVGSMASLQQATEARELALENIYPRFKARLCRRLGLSSRTQKDEIIASARRRRLPVSEIELRQVLSDAELTLAGEKIDDAQLVSLVSRMRRLLSQIGK